MVVINGAEIVGVGPSSELGRWPAATVVDLGDRTIVPGFIDAHNHLSLTALHPLWADLTGVTDRDAARRLLAEAAVHIASSDHDPWVRAVGWNDRALSLTKADLDELEPDRPLVIAHFSYHECIVNSRALDELGITSSTRIRPVGHRTRRGRSLDGRLIERAWGEAHAHSVRSYGDPDRWADLIVERCNVLRTEGITAVHDPACAPSAEAVYRMLARDGRLPISILAMPHPEGILGDPDAARLDGPPTGEGDPLLRVGPGKLFADGGSHPNIDGHIHGNHVQFGLGFDTVAAGIDRLTSSGFGAAVHTMGNAMLDTVLDAFERCADRRSDAAGPFRIEHVTLAEPRHVQRMAVLGVAGVVQPGFVRLLGGMSANAPIDEATWMPFRSLLDAGVVLGGSSDDPCDATHGASFGRARSGLPAGSTPATCSSPINGWGWRTGYAHTRSALPPPVASSPNEARSIPESGPIWWSSMERWTAMIRRRWRRPGSQAGACTTDPADHCGRSPTVTAPLTATRTCSTRTITS